MTTKPMMEFHYLKRIKIQLIIIILFMTAFIPIAIKDGQKYNVAAVIGIIVLYYIFVIWQDSNNKVLIYPNKIVQENGAGPFKKVKEMQWNDVAILKDETGLFTFGRAFYIQDNQEKPQRIHFNSTLERYQELLEVIIKHSPNIEVDIRAQKMARKIGANLKSKRRR
jgi:hypothetical protein